MNANDEAKLLLSRAIDRLVDILDDEPIICETPLEVQSAIQSAIAITRSAQQCLEFVPQADKPMVLRNPGDPTHQQGQFLAFIREYMMRNSAGVAPTHAILQHFFNLTAPSVNSMLIRLEKRGFIRRTPGKARAIELVIGADEIPPLDRPFKVW